MLVENNHHYVTRDELNSTFCKVNKKINDIQILDKIFQILNNVNIQHQLIVVLIEVLLDKYVQINFHVMLKIVQVF